MGKGDTYLRYKVHGAGLESIGTGLRELRMPEHRMSEAVSIIKEVLLANDAVEFRWYKPPATEELSCYWDAHDTNVLWVTANEVHVISDPTRVIRPDRPTTWQKEEGAYVGWLLPGAERGVGGGARRPEIATVLCPVEFVRIPKGTVCQFCDVEHHG